MLARSATAARTVRRGQRKVRVSPRRRGQAPSPSAAIKHRSEKPTKSAKNLIIVRLGSRTSEGFGLCTPPRSAGTRSASQKAGEKARSQEVAASSRTSLSGSVNYETPQSSGRAHPPDTHKSPVRGPLHAGRSEGHQSSGGGHTIVSHFQKWGSDCGHSLQTGSIFSMGFSRSR